MVQNNGCAGDLLPIKNKRQTVDLSLCHVIIARPRGRPFPSAGPFVSCPKSSVHAT
jgi:hypothetical protein